MLTKAAAGKKGAVKWTYMNMRMKYTASGFYFFRVSSFPVNNWTYTGK
jgi:hypothetical protein